MGFWIFTVVRYAADCAEVLRSRRTARESSAAEPSASSLEFPRENLGGCYVLRVI